MPAHQLLVDRVERIFDREVARFLCHPGVEHSLEHEIAKLFRKRRPIALVDCVENFVCLFECVRLDRVERLFTIPRAAAGAT